MSSSTRLTADTYLEHLRAESARFLEALTGCDPGARVPACPDWDAGDLLWHLAEVQWTWASVVTGRPGGPPEQHPERPTTWAGLLSTYDDYSGRLADALAAADPDEPAWTWADEQTVGFTFRRQAHEALVHRLDAEQAAGLPPAPVDPALAADGVAELLEVMYGGELPAWGRFDPVPGVLRVTVTDTGHVLHAVSGLFTGTDPDSGRVLDGPHVAVVEGPDGEPAAVVEGAAGDLDAWLWHRRDDTGVRRDGDPDVLAAFATATSVELT
jgi:uncharacterized protein (TIGR03083 family)